MQINQEAENTAIYGNFPSATRPLSALERQRRPPLPSSKGNLDGGPGNYDNAGLKQLLIDHGASDLNGTQGVGATDVQTIGAVAAAINRGQLSLQDVVNSGTIDHLDRYGQIPIRRLPDRPQPLRQHSTHVDAPQGLRNR